MWKITHSQDAEVESSLELGHSPTESDDELSENTQHMRMLVTRAHRRRSGRAEVISSPAQDLDAWERDRRIQLCGGLDPLQDIQGVGALHQFTGDPAVEETDQTSQLDDLINKMVTDASPIRALPVSNWWSHATLSRWKHGCALMAKDIKCLMDGLPPEADDFTPEHHRILFTAVTLILAMPARILRHEVNPNLLQRSYSDELTPQRRAKKTSNYIKQGLFSKAMQCQTSHGNAQITDEVFDILKAKFPEPLQPTVPIAHREDNPRLENSHPSVKAARAMIHKAAGTDTHGADVYAWSMHMLKVIRGAKKEEDNGEALESSPRPFLQQFTRVVHRLQITHQISTALAHMVATGLLCALHKLSISAQEERKRTQLPPLLRPVVIGGMMLKYAMKLRMGCTEVQEETTQAWGDLQYCGKPSGIEIYGHKLAAQYAQGRWIFTLDMQDAFQHAEGNAIGEGFAEFNPSLLDLHNRYGSPLQPRVIATVTEEGKVSQKTIRCKTGTQIGSVLGSPSFSHVTRPPFERIAAKYKPVADISMVMDDVSIALTLGLDTRTAMQYVSDIVNDIQEELNALNLILNLSKCKLLLPEDLEPEDLPDDVELPVGLEVTNEGISICGFPLGKQLYVKHFYKEHADAAISNAMALDCLKRQEAILVLRRCTIHVMSFYHQAIPTHMITTELQDFHTRLTNLALQYLNAPKAGTAPVLPDADMQLVLQELALPLSMNGGGVTNMVDMAPIAHFCSLVRCTYRNAWLDDCFQAGPPEGWSTICDRIIQVIGNKAEAKALSGKQVEQHFPYDEGAKALQGFYKALLFPGLDENGRPLPALQLQKELTTYQHNWRRAKINDSLNDLNNLHKFGQPQRREQQAQYIRIRTARDSDNVRLMTSILEAPLGEAGCRMSDQTFCVALQKHLGLPPQTHQPLHDHQDHSYKVARCDGSHNTGLRTEGSLYFDKAHNHPASGCHKAAQAVNERHTEIQKVFAEFAKEAGCTAKQEPSTSKHIFDHTISEDEAATLFPDSTTVKQHEQLKRIQRELREERGRPDTPDRRLRIRKLESAYYYVFLELGPAIASVALRLDLLIQLRNGERLAVDVTVRHRTAPTYAAGEVAYLKSRTEKKEHLGTIPKGNRRHINQNQPQSQLKKAEMEKERKYAPIAVKYEMDRATNHWPKLQIIGAAFGSEGTVGPGAEKLISIILDQNLIRERQQGIADDGSTPHTRQARFAKRFRSALIMAILRGTAIMYVRANTTGILPIELRRRFSPRKRTARSIEADTHASSAPRKKKFIQGDSAISGLLPKLVHKQFFLPILVAAAGPQALSKVLQQNTDKAKSLLEPGEWNDLINKLHEGGNWDAYRVGFNPLRDTFPKANVGAQLQEDILRPIARSHEFRLYCQSIRLSLDVSLQVPSRQGLSLSHEDSEDQSVREGENMRGSESKKHKKKNKKREREGGFADEDHSDGTSDTETFSEEEIEREIARERTRLQKAEKERDIQLKQGYMVLVEPSPSEDEMRERAKSAIRRRRRRYKRDRGEHGVHTFNVEVHHGERCEERDLGEGQANRNGRIGMGDEDGKRERRKAREQRRAEGKKKKLSDEAESRREKILREIVLSQMRDEDDGEEDDFSGFEEESSNQEQSETEDELTRFRKKSKQGVTLQEADVEVDASLRANINVHTPTCGEVDTEKEGESSGQPPMRQVYWENVEKFGDGGSQLNSPRRG